jgi:predicted lipoprotein with Yx(FWY)xxD motif
MKRLITLSTAIAATVTLAACGSSASTTAAAGAGPSANTTVAVTQLPGVGRVLVDHSGMALYSPDVEARGKIACEAACTAFWKPLTFTKGTPTGSSNTGKLGVIKRPDGSSQVTDNGMPLYTFSEDSPGKAKGNGFTDDFNGQHFTWRVIRAGGTTASSAGSGSGGTPTTSSSSAGSYGY